MQKTKKGIHWSVSSNYMCIGLYMEREIYGRLLFSPLQGQPPTNSAGTQLTWAGQHDCILQASSVAIDSQPVLLFYRRQFLIQK